MVLALRLQIWAGRLRRRETTDTFRDVLEAILEECDSEDGPLSVATTMLH